MFHYAATVRFTGHVPDELSQREFNEIKRQAYRAVGEYWHAHFLPQHFTTAGARKYGYTPRQGEQGGQSPKQFWRSYTGRKLRYLGHKRPLVKSGESERRATARPAKITVTVTSTRSRAKVVIPAPALNFRPPHSRVDMRREVETVTDDEIAILQDVFDRTMQAGLDAARATHASPEP